MTYQEVISSLELMNNPRNVEGMARFGIRPKTKVLGVPMPELRKLAKEIKKIVGSPTSHNLALELWDAGIHEARILACIVADPKQLTLAQIKRWVAVFDSWDVCDQCCMNLFDKSKIAIKEIGNFAKDSKEFVRRTAFALIAALAFHNKEMKDKDFEKFFSLIKKYSVDERNFVKKAVNWALRQIGKRSKALNKKAIKLAKEIHKIDTKSARWIANNAIIELTKHYE